MIDRVHQVASALLKTPEIQKRFAEIGGQAGGNTPAEFGAFVRQQVADWRQTVETAKLSID